MGAAALPELKKYMDKRLYITMNADRKISGILRGYDPFTNLVLDESFVHSPTIRLLLETSLSVETVLLALSQLIELITPERFRLLYP
ncbi:hypothetical protein DSO57_1007633 [Entomophthora muscae]|uniref:Uncharacterized protein n=1 Tax=Entomophthora muscae TaxID=34485 RepID=A0ACC2TUQ7_9FUNG|nr:hypothetical protein DSO57_1007633 [Entomophthora muscae]